MPADPADPAQLASLLARHGARPKQRLGQNFLVDRELRDRVVEAAGIEAADEVLEVGAGPGTLTVALAGRCRRLVAVELDRRLVAALRRAVAGLGSVEIVQDDVLKLDLASIFPGGREVVVGNIPYYLTGALLRRLLEPEPRPRRLSLVVQREVAERWTGGRDWSLATVAVRTFADPRLELVLPAAAFEPRPKVDSALVVMDVRERPAIEVVDLSAFFRFVEAVFQFRRKQLGGALARLSNLDAGDAAGLLRELGVDPARRPQTLDLDEWRAVYLAFDTLS